GAVAAHAQADRRLDHRLHAAVRGTRALPLEGIERRRAGTDACHRHRRVEEDGQQRAHASLLAGLAERLRTPRLRDDGARRRLWPLLALFGRHALRVAEEVGGVVLALDAQQLVELVGPVALAVVRLR